MMKLVCHTTNVYSLSYIIFLVLMLHCYLSQMEDLLCKTQLNMELVSYNNNTQLFHIINSSSNLFYQLLHATVHFI